MLAAHKTDGDEAANARVEILTRYSSSVYQYILAATRDSHAAEDLVQEFALRFVRGDYKNAAPARGRFRDYLKASLRNLVTDYFRKQPKREAPLSAATQIADETKSDQLARLESEFQTHWRQQVLNHAWARLKQFETERNNHFYTVLRLRAENPHQLSNDIADEISRTIGSRVTSEWVRQKLHRARQKFADYLISEIRASLTKADGPHDAKRVEEDIQEELTELGLRKYM